MRLLSFTTGVVFFMQQTTAIAAWGISGRCYNPVDYDLDKCSVSVDKGKVHVSFLSEDNKPINYSIDITRISSVDVQRITKNSIDAEATIPMGILLNPLFFLGFLKKKRSQITVNYFDINNNSSAVFFVTERKEGRAFATVMSRAFEAIKQGSQVQSVQKPSTNLASCDIEIGMTTQQVRSCIGDPTRVNADSRKANDRESWTYQSRELFFADNILVHDMRF